MIKWKVLSKLNIFQYTGWWHTTTINKHLFYRNNEIHSIHTRFKTNLHPPTANLRKFQKAVHCSAIKIFNNLPHEIKDLANETHSIHTRFKTNLHPPTANLRKFQKAVHCSAIKIFNNLPHEIKDLANDILPFRNALKRFLLTNSFYNSKEYFN